MHFNLFQLDTKSPALLEKLGHQAKKSLAGTNAQSFPIKCPVFFDHTKGSDRLSPRMPGLVLGRFQKWPGPGELQGSSRAESFIPGAELGLGGGPWGGDSSLLLCFRGGEGGVQSREGLVQGHTALQSWDSTKAPASSAQGAETSRGLAPSPVNGVTIPVSQEFESDGVHVSQEPTDFWGRALCTCRSLSLPPARSM